MKVLLLTFMALLPASAIWAQRVEKPIIRKPVVRQPAAVPAAGSSALRKPVATGTGQAPANPSSKPKPILRMKDYRLTPSFSVRKTKYSANFNNPSKQFVQSDGSHLNIQFQKNPAYGGQSNNINTKVSAGQQGVANGLKCASSNVIINAQTTDFGVADFAKQSVNIYPGAIYTFENFMNGSFLPQSGARNPITISTENTNVNGDTYVQVNNPSQATIRNGIAELFRRFTGSGGNAETSIQLYETFTSADCTLKITAGGSGWGASVNNAFSQTDKSEHRYLTIDAKKILFTINTTPPENGFFTDPAVESASPNMMFIGTVAYGIRILANVEVTFKSSAAANDFNAKYNAGVWQANADLNYLQNSSSVETRINAYVIGGPNEGLITLNKDQLISSLNKIMAGASYQNAKPISYSLCDMAGEVIGSKSSTDQFAVQLCVPVARLKSAMVTVQCGMDGKDHDTHYTYSLLNGRNSSIASYTNNTDNSEFEASSTYSDMFNRIASNATNSDFMDTGGGQLQIHIEPNGHDTWNITKITLRLDFDDNTTQQMSWQNLVISQNNKNLHLYFDQTFHAK